MPYVQITDMGTIRGNLAILATFTGRRGLGGKGAMKLHINTATGTFGTKDGLYQNIFQRSADDSLLNADTIRTINDMFQHAIKNIPSDSNIEITRKALFNGFRGLVYLAYNGYNAKQGYVNIANMIDGIKKSLKNLIDNFVLSAKVDSNVFVTGVNTNKTESFGQRDFLPKVKDGICYGICMDWCRRVLLKGSFSFGTSSKKLFEDVKDQVKEKRRKNLREIKRDINSSSNFTSEDMRTAELERQRDLTRGDLNDELRVNKILMKAARYQKKGTYAALAQHTQHLPSSNGVSNNIVDLMNRRRELEETLTKGYDVRNVYVPHLGTSVPQNVQFTTEKKSELEQVIKEIDTALNIIRKTKPGQDPYKIASEKFSRMKIINRSQEEVLLPVVLCMSDPSDFEPYLTTLIDNCLNTNSSNAFFLGWNCSTSYCGIGSQAGHAMAFAHDSVNSKYYAMDPNFGEFSSNTKGGLIFIFSVILSHYSFEYIIDAIDTRTIILEPAGP